MNSFVWQLGVLGLGRRVFGRRDRDPRRLSRPIASPQRYAVNRAEVQGRDSPVVGVGERDDPSRDELCEGGQIEIGGGATQIHEYVGVGAPEQTPPGAGVVARKTTGRIRHQQVSVVAWIVAATAMAKPTARVKKALRKPSMTA